MRVKQIATKIAVFGFVACTAIVGISPIASAHVTVKPAEVVTAGYQTFTVNVPNEKEMPTTSIKVLIPESVASATPTQKAGWQVTTEKEGTGEEARVVSITWSEGTINDGLRDEFTFSSKVPKEAGELQWKAYQTYADGTVVSWDQADEGGHGSEGNSGPFSVTKVVAESESDSSIQKADKAAAEAKTVAERASYIAAAGFVIGLTGVFLATRKKN